MVRGAHAEAALTAGWQGGHRTRGTARWAGQSPKAGPGAGHSAASHAEPDVAGALPAGWWALSYMDQVCEVATTSLSLGTGCSGGRNPSKPKKLRFLPAEREVGGAPGTLCARALTRGSGLAAPTRARDRVPEAPSSPGLLHRHRQPWPPPARRSAAHGGRSSACAAVHTAVFSPVPHLAGSWRPSGTWHG